MHRKRVAILGSTGSIGTQALDVIARHPERFDVVALAAGTRVDALQAQAARFSVEIVSSAADGPPGLMRVAAESGAEIVLAATDGFVAFDAVFAAVERGIDIAVANKELVVAAGELLVQAAARSGSRIVPVDSEHSAIFQLLVGEDPAAVRAIVLTASGGPFWRKTREEIAAATLEQALAHPTWNMGVKNTIDSATMLNKGLEVIEASRLFGLAADRIAVLVHPQSIAHGMVVFTDGNVKAQLAAPDMRLPIGYALAYPDRLPSQPDPVEPSHPAPVEPRHPELVEPRHPELVEGRTFDALVAAGAVPDTLSLRYDFERPDLERFPCLRLAYEALAAGGTMPAVLSAANEIAVRAFVGGEIRFADIPDVIENVMQDTRCAEVSLTQVREADREARVRARETVATLHHRIEV
ncbi:MAG TPA: 1-deoxy-D-xylulose-5-phosphate reductoisomerase [Candidatus Baltobacteraceae bacterium]